MLVILMLIAAALVSGCGGGEDPAEPTFDGVAVEDPGPIHVHGLGINPRDGALFIATHTGLFRVPPGEEEAIRVADRYQDTMGFTVVGSDRFLGSGHPDTREDLPPYLGLIQSDDAGESWQPVSLVGDADFHVLEAQDDRVYGFGSDWESRKPQFLVSSDGGESWEERGFPEPLVSLAVHPSDAERIVASGASAVHVSRDGGRTWRRVSSSAGFVAWRSPSELIMVGADGGVGASSDGRSWQVVGDVGGRPAAFEAEDEELYVALHDGTIKRSNDGGRSWSVRSRP